jgi:hypothetical protein
MGRRDVLVMGARTPSRRPGQTAVRAGYDDQSHMITEFRRPRRRPARRLRVGPTAATDPLPGLAEVLANRLPTQEEYIGALPPVAIVPWFLAGSLFPISALPAGLAVVAKVLPNTHVLALLRYGLVDRS